jgi:pimeloyl-ACP methyl ester carboxylesterase
MSFAPTINSAVYAHDRTLTLPDGRTVGYAVYGDPEGRPILALHGTPACRLMYAVADAAARRHNLCLYAVERPGYALSAPLPPGQTLSVIGYTEELRAVAAVLGLDRFGLMGISGGGPYAAAAAAVFGDRATVLALISPLGPIADLPADVTLTASQRWFFREVPRWPWVQAAGAAGFRLLFRAAPAFTAWLFRLSAGRSDRALLRDPNARLALRAITAEALRQGSAQAPADHRAFADAWAGDLDRITAPAMLWIGNDDHIVPMPAAHALARMIPGCKLIELPATGHFWVLANAEAVCAEMARRLGEAPN